VTVPGLTPFQTVGPFFAFGLVIDGGETMAAVGAAGRPIAVEGTVCDGKRDPLPDALIEIWQANAAGKYTHPADDRNLPRDPAFDGFGRVPTSDDGSFAFTTVMPGRVPGPSGGLQAPHLAIGVLARGLQTRLVTRMYFEDEAANVDDPLLLLVPAARRSTLIARRIAGGRYRFDIVLQGRDETVFFDV
jgi:protocatechuate 3,4-dioxygenase alpha subunit